MTRRDAGRVILGAATVAGSSEFLAERAEAAPALKQQKRPTENQFAPPAPDRFKNYQPKFFSAEEFHTLDVFTDLLIPADETPGARDAHVAPFIDFVVNAAAEYAPNMQKEWRRAMAWLQAQDFGSLSKDRQLALMREMSQPEHDRKKKHPGFFAYRLIKDMTLHAFYTSREGLIGDLDYQGMAYLTHFPGCAHLEHHRV